MTALRRKRDDGLEFDGVHGGARMEARIKTMIVEMKRRRRRLIQGFVSLFPSKFGSKQWDSVLWFASFFTHRCC